MIIDSSSHVRLARTNSAAPHRSSASTQECCGTAGAERTNSVSSCSARRAEVEHCCWCSASPSSCCKLAEGCRSVSGRAGIEMCEGDSWTRCNIESQSEVCNGIGCPSLVGNRNNSNCRSVAKRNIGDSRKPLPVLLDLVGTLALAKCRSNQIACNASAKATLANSQQRIVPAGHCRAASRA